MKYETALIAGIVASDGHLDKNFHIIRIITGSKSFLEFLENLLKTITKEQIRVYVSKSGFGKTKYTVYLNDKNLYKLLNEKFNVPKGKKSLAIKPPEKLDKEEEKAYIEGWLAGEGSISHDKNPQIALWSKSKEIIYWLRDKLKENNVNAQIYYSEKKQQYLLMIRRKNDFQIFIENFHFVHPDKIVKLASVLERPRFRTS